MPVQVLVALLLIQLPAGAPVKEVENGPKTFVSATHMGDSDGVPSSWLNSGPDLTDAVICGVNL